jgi:glycosyltransferase involved in cell wall biosynthesis
MVVTYANYLADRGHDVNIYVNIKDALLYVNPSIRIIKIPIKGVLGTIAWAISSRIDADIVISDIVILSGLLRAFGKKNLVYFSQGNDIYHYRNRFMQAIVRFFYYLSLSRFCIPCIVVSPKLAIEMSQFGRGIVIVPNGIDPLEFKPDNGEESLKNGGVVLIFNRPDYSKGIDIGLKALESAKTCFASLRVWVIGEKLLSMDLIDRNLGYLDASGVKDILRKTSILLYPSRHEGFPLLVLECLASGKPVVTTKAVSWLTHLKTAWVSEVDDVDALRKGILSVLLDMILYKELRFNGLRVSKKFDLEKSKEKFVRSLSDIFESL